MRVALNSYRLGAALLGALALGVVRTEAQTVEKVADLTVWSSPDGEIFGSSTPMDRFTQVGTNLWFTTTTGGYYSAGTVSRFDLVTREVVEVASFDNNSGKASESSLLVIGDEAFFTTVNGGAGNKGTLAKIGLESGVITVLHTFAADGKPTGATSRAGFTRIGDELWTTTTAGGVLGKGVIVKYNLTNGVASLVADLDGPDLGSAPYEGFTPVGSNAWYFTTFTGGTNTGSGFANGAGTLGRLTFDAQANPLVTRVLCLSTGYTAFPAARPTLVGTNSLYFTTVGPNTAPGAIVRYDLDTGAWTNLFSFHANTADLVQYGARPGYGGLVEWLGELYFINQLGGTSNKGVVAKFNIASNTVIKLADLEGAGASSLGSASGSRGSYRGTGTLVEEDDRFFLYFPIPVGGAYDYGTIIRVVLPPPPIQLTIAPSRREMLLSWTGGYGPFTVQSRAALNAGSWTNLLEGVTNRSVTLPMAGDRNFFRVVGNP